MVILIACMCSFTIDHWHDATEKTVRTEVYLNAIPLEALGDLARSMLQTGSF